MELFEQTTLGSLTLKNRIFRSATNEHLATEDGRITEDLLKCYEDLAAGGVGTIITGHYCVVADAKTSRDQATIPGNDIADLRRAAERVHRYGTNLIMQLNHGGMSASKEVNGCDPKSPADLSREDMNVLRHLYVEAAVKAQQAGLDGVQVHMAHGYLLSNFADPFQNTRTDEYGGSTEGRLRFPAEIIREIRETCGSGFAILVKVNADATQPCDYVTILRQVLETCREAGADAVEVSGLAFSKQRPDRDEPYFLQETREACQDLGLPVILVGGLDSRRKLQQVLDAGIPYVSLSRSLICQPEFVNRMAAGEEKSPCLRCNGCFRVFKTKYVRCVLHSEAIPRLRQMYGTEKKEQ